MCETLAKPAFRGRADGENRVSNRTIAGAAAEIARQGQRVARSVSIRPILFRKQAHDKSRRAIATLRRTGLRELPLEVGCSSTRRQRLHGVHLVVGNGWQEDQAAIDRAVRASAAIVADQSDRAGAALAFGATFFRAGQSLGTKKVEESGGGRLSVNGNRPSIQNKVQRLRGRDCSGHLDSDRSIAPTSRQSPKRPVCVVHPPAIFIASRGRADPRQGQSRDR